MRSWAGTVLLLTALLVATGVDAKGVRERDTIKSLERQHVDVRPGEVIINSADLARENYREFLDIVSDDPELRAEALRRLGDLELEAAESAELADNIEMLDDSGYDSAVELYQQLLESYPQYARNDSVLYQLARSYETGGRTEEALVVLDEIVERFPDTPLIDEIEFRRGEMLFIRKEYAQSQAAYQAVIDYGPDSRYYEQSLYKLGWSEFKLALHEDSLDSFFELLDRKLAGIDIRDGDEQFENLGRADQELVEDTFRVLSITFSYLDGAESIDAFMRSTGNREYAHIVYMNLGDLYLAQERYVDAAEAYAAFVELDPHHPKAPLLQVEVIEAYKQGGFPTLVLEGKKGFVERYATGGEYWIRNGTEDNTAVGAHLKANLTDLAQYYHAEAQKDGEAAAYAEAARWYRQYLDSFPDDPGSAKTNFLLAEILYESGDYAAATREYEQTAYEYPVHGQAAEAGYAALLSYREHEAELPLEARAEWHQAYLDSGLRFAETYPEHPESAAVLTAISEDLFAEEQFDLAIAVAQSVVGKQPPVDAELARTSWTVIAHSQFDLENYVAAESAYYQLRSYTPPDDLTAQQEIKDRIASSIYRQGEQARDAGQLQAAVDHFTRLGVAVPDSEFRATAEYDAAAVLINMAAWDQAANVLEQYRQDHPDSQFADDVSQKLAVTYLESGKGAEAAQEFERIALAETGDPDVQREALWKAAELYETAGAVSDEERVLDEIVARYPDPLSESIEARARLLEIAGMSGNERLRTERLESLVRADATAGAQRSDRTRYLAATAAIELAEPIREKFMVYPLTQPLENSMKVKRGLMEDAIAAYSDAAEYGVAEVTTASTYHLAAIYEKFASDLMSSERPTDLDALALEQYELLLEEQVYPFEEKAIDLYTTNTDRAADGVYDAWVQKSFDRLAGLMPARYAKTERSENVVTILF